MRVILEFNGMPNAVLLLRKTDNAVSHSLSFSCPPLHSLCTFIILESATPRLFAKSQPFPSCGTIVNSHDMIEKESIVENGVA